MKKLIKNYLAKLQENDKKGFSLVELIIVMAIMAILVGVVASQVLPYMEKSRLSKDQENLASIQMDLSSSIAMSGESCTGGTDTLANLEKVTNAAAVTEFKSLRNNKIPTFKELKFKSKAANDSKTGGEIYVKVDESTGEITVMISKDGKTPADAKLSVSSSNTTSSTSN